jgi:hypothetical protein
MQFQFSGPIWYWRGPSPFYFVTVPDEESEIIKEESSFVTYGWGMIPVTVRIGRTEWATSLWPKDDRYIVPVKLAVRRAEKLDEGDTAALHLTVRTP